MFDCFFFGVLTGIWLDWATWLANGTQLLGPGGTPPSSPITYEVEPWGDANLLVSANQSINLARSDNGSGTTMNFQGSSPCSSGGTGSAYCKIGNSPSNGTYLFSCDASDGYTCPDPGLQVRTTGFNTMSIVKPIGFFNDLKDVARHTVQPDRRSTLYVETTENQGGEAGKSPESKARVSSKTSVPSAFVQCSTGTAEVDPRNPPASKNTPITVPVGQAMYWYGSVPFTIQFNGTSPCNQSTINSNSQNNASCQMNSSGSFNYTLTVNSGCSNPSPSETLKTN